jgi:hypothetical protein
MDHILHDHEVPENTIKSIEKRNLHSTNLGVIECLPTEEDNTKKYLELKEAAGNDPLKQQ